MLILVPVRPIRHEYPVQAGRRFAPASQCPASVGRRAPGLASRVGGRWSHVNIRRGSRGISSGDGQGGCLTPEETTAVWPTVDFDLPTNFASELGLTRTRRAAAALCTEEGRGGAWTRPQHSCWLSKNNILSFVAGSRGLGAADP